jgi:hypothetical protein
LGLLMVFILRPSVHQTLFLTPLLLLLFAWAQAVSLDNPFFLVFICFSLSFLGLATFLLVSTDIEHASKRIKQLFQAIILVTIIVSVIGAASIAAFSRGGAHHSLAIRPDDLNLAMEYGSLASGYYGR